MELISVTFINFLTQIFGRLIARTDSNPVYNSNPLIFPGEERYFKNLRQLTFGGTNAEAYFSFDNKKITFQATSHGFKCDQIFRFDDVTKDDMSSKRPKLISTGYGRTTCSYFSDDDTQILYASTHLGDLECPLKSCSKEAEGRNKTLDQLCRSVRYVWDVYPTYDIFLATEEGLTFKRLTDTYGYDAEGTVSPIGDTVVYTSMASGDLELWTMQLDGSQKKQLTSDLGYDGGAFFSPDGKKLVFRASRPKTKAEIDLYKTLLSFNLVSPLQMEIFTMNADGTDQKQITQLGGSNWAPFYHPDGRRIIFSSDFANPKNFSFQLFMVDDDGRNLRQITNSSVFNSFPMFTSDGRYLIFGSSRNATNSPHEMNLFLAEWIEKSDKNHQNGQNFGFDEKSDSLKVNGNVYINFNIKLFSYKSLFFIMFGALTFLFVVVLCFLL